MENKITSRDTIAGMPAFSIREFFARCEAPYSIDDFRAWLLVDEATAHSTANQLVKNGYLDLTASPDDLTNLTKTPKAIALAQSAPALPLSREEGYNIVLKLLKEIALINSSSVAHRIESAVIFGGLLSTACDDISCIEVEINIMCNCVTNKVVQQRLQMLEAEQSGRQGYGFADDAARLRFSYEIIKSRLYAVHDLLSMRLRLHDNFSRQAPYYG